MKHAVVTILIVAGCFAAVALILRLLGVNVPLPDPINGGALAVAASIVGMLPLTLSRSTDPVTLMPRALVGTVLHMLVAAGMAIVVMVARSGGDRQQLILWLSGGYLISLVAVIRQSQRILTTAGNMPRSAEHHQDAVRT